MLILEGYEIKKYNGWDFTVREFSEGVWGFSAVKGSTFSAGRVEANSEAEAVEKVKERLA